MGNQEESTNLKNQRGLENQRPPKKGRAHFDNYISPYWYGNLIDNSQKTENLKNIYEAFRSGFISLEDFNQSLSDFNDSRPPARSI